MLLFKRNNKEQVLSKNNSKQQIVDDTRVYYFYRSLNGNYIQTDTDPESKRFILFNNDAKKILCPNHGEWEKYNINNRQLYCERNCKCDGLIVSFNTLEDNVFEETLEPNHLSENDLLDLDDNGISRDLVIVKISENYTTGYFNIQLVLINHKAAQEINKTSVRNIPRLRRNFSFNIKKNDYWYDNIGYENYNDKLSNLMECIPQNIYDFALNHLKDLIRSIFGKNLNFTYSGNKKNELWAICKYPYEPNLYDLTNYSKIKINRYKTNGFNLFCQYYGIKPYKTLHKYYLEKDPLVITAYKGLIIAGFKDTNIINTVYESNISYLFYYDKNELSRYEGIKKLCKNLIPLKGEKYTINLLIKSVQNENDLVIIFDAIDIFNKYFNTIPDELKKDILKNGFITRTHNELVRYDYGIHNENIVIDYKKETYLLEDQINEYTFKLPVDTNELGTIGACLHNCVGTYRDKVLEKKCVIVYAIREGKHKLCIEVRDKTIWQQRANYNQNPTGEDAEVMKLWQQKHDLIFTGNRW